MKSTESFAVLLPAAGASARFGCGKNKLLETLAGQSVLARSVGAFLSRDDVSHLIIAASQPDALRQALGSIANDPRLRVVAGASCRAASVRAGLSHVPAEIEWVAVHDAARPLVSAQLINRVRRAAKEHGAAAPAMPVALTVKQATGPLPAAVEKTIPRSALWAMQTPQIVRRSDLLAAFESCPIPLEQITDDLQLLELAGIKAWLVEGEERNLKITTAIDLVLAEQILSSK